MMYLHQLRHRNLAEMHGEIRHLVIRDPQKPDTASNDNDNSQPDSKTDRKTDSKTTRAATSNSNTDVATRSISNLRSVTFAVAPPTFTGAVAGYTTLGVAESAAESFSQQTVTYVVTEPQRIETSSIQNVWTPTSSSVAPVETTIQTPPSTSFEPATTYVASTTSSAAAVLDSSSAALSSTLPTSIAVAISSPALLSSSIPLSSTATRSLSTMTSSPAATAAASSSAGMSSGGKAGLATGIVVIIALIAGGALWFFWKKKKDKQWREPDDEKAGFGSAVGAMPMRGEREQPSGAQWQSHGASAPRLSLRPVTQFLPDLAAAKKGLSQGNPHNKMNKPAGMAAAGASRNLTPANPNGNSLDHRSGGVNATNPFTDSANPVRDQAKAVASPPNATVTPPMSDHGSRMDASTAVGVGAAAGVAMAAGAGNNGDGHPRNRQGSPAEASLAAVGPPPGNVYRVQLDFQPSLEDEIELRGGQLVRVLHEYDDGWVLCARLDRSKQGVAPRTCLSARPVKPRPANGPPRMGPHGRPITPHGQPMNPAQYGPKSPGQGPPLSPAGGPGPRSKSSASSHGPSRPGTANSNRPMSPPSLGQRPMMTQTPNQMAPGQYNQPPRPLSPGSVARSPDKRQPNRSQSPGPYGANAGPTPMTANQRRRSNSTGAVQAWRNNPPSSSPLTRGEPIPRWKPPKPQNSNAIPGVAL